MPKTGDMLVSQLSSLFFRWMSYAFQLTECNKTGLVFADVGPSSIIPVGFNFSSSLTNSHFSMKKKNKNEELVLLIYSKPPNLYFLRE